MLLYANYRFIEIDNYDYFKTNQTAHGRSNLYQYWKPFKANNQKLFLLLQEYWLIPQQFKILNHRITTDEMVMESQSNLNCEIWNKPTTDYFKSEIRNKPITTSLVPKKGCDLSCQLDANHCILASVLRQMLNMENVLNVEFAFSVYHIVTLS